MSGSDIGQGAVPAPPGITPNFVDPPSHTEQNIILHTICLTLITSAVAFRVFGRLKVTKLGADDYMAVFAWISSVIFSGLLLAGDDYGLGRHLWDVQAYTLMYGLEILFVIELWYIPIALSIKLTFLLFYLRIFNVSKKMRWSIWGGIVANVIFYVVQLFLSIFHCNPVAKNFNPELPGTCGAQSPLPYSSGTWGFLSDFYIFLLPLPQLWKLQMKTSRRVRLALIFGVGLFACVASVVRFVYTVMLIDIFDVTWNYSQLTLWTVLELDIGLLCACLPALPLFFNNFGPHGLGSYWSRFTSFLSGSRSRSSREANTGSDLELGQTATKRGASGGSGTDCSNRDGFYKAANHRAEAARELDGRGAGNYRFTTETSSQPGSGSKKPTETWAPQDGIGVVKTIGVENHTAGKD